MRDLLVKQAAVRASMTLEVEGNRHEPRGQD
jgi:hypothetical protein